MNRCSKHVIASFSIAACALLASAATLFPTEANAQRVFPQKVQRGEIQFTEPPQVLLNGQPERLAPGVRVRDTHNRIPLTGALRGQTFVVNYLRDPMGLVREIWLLTPEEAARPVQNTSDATANARRPAPTTADITKLHSN